MPNKVNGICIGVLCLASTSSLNMNAFAHEPPKSNADYSIGIGAGSRNGDGLLFRKHWAASYIQISALASGELGDETVRGDFLVASDIRIGRSLYRGIDETIGLVFGVTVFGSGGTFSSGLFAEAVQKPLTALKRVHVGPGVSFDFFNPGTEGFEVSIALSLLMIKNTHSENYDGAIGLYPSTAFFYSWQ